MFREIGAAPPAGIFSVGHLILLVFFGGLGIAFYYYTKKWPKEKVMVFFKIFSLVLLGLEVFKIVWNLLTYGFSYDTLNFYIPLYYCSIFLYALLLLAWFKGKIAYAARVWMVYGGIIAGVAFLIYPSSSLIYYPFYHFLSMHSILFHVGLVLVGVIILKHEYYVPKRSDFMTFIYFSLVFMVTAFLFNKIFKTNLMFLEEPIAIPLFSMINDASPFVFRFLMFFAQLSLPFVFTHLFFLLVGKTTKLKIYQSPEKSEEISTSKK